MFTGTCGVLLARLNVDPEAYSVCGLGASTVSPRFPTSRHFVIQGLSDGVFAVIATNEGWAVGNAGIVNLGDHTLVFDALSNHLAAADLNSCAETLTGRVVDYLLIGHGHRDHYRGTQSFPRATISATRKTCERMAALWKERIKMVEKEGIDLIRKGIRDEFEAWKSSPATTSNDRMLWESYEQSLLQGLETYNLKLPTLGFETEMSFHGSERKAMAITYGGGHSESDAFLFLPEERIAYLGDLLFIGYQPYFGDGNPEEFLSILDKVEALDPKILVPGHGPVGTVGDLQSMRDYVFALREKVKDAKGSEARRKAALEEPAPPPFDNFKWGAFWKENLEFMLNRA